MLSDYDKGLFTPDCLVGVETTLGFVTKAWLPIMTLTPRTFIYTTTCRNLTADEVKYYISDDSDTTVSFADYVNMFYDGWA